jgi:hypothetical protein
MLPRIGILWATVLGVAFLFVAKAPAQTDQPALPEGVEVQARGPVHEAFAEPVQARPEPSMVVSKQPPDPIEEAPPDEKPAGDHVVWIPGYWGWEDDQKDYLWVSGFWRVPPPDRQWVPGSWQQVDGGWQWTAGFWEATGQTEVTYLPAPPPSIDEGASTAAPDDNSFYVPGTWVYRERRYLWRPGFWLGYRPDWVWIPAHYCWTPAGYVFVDGYWDVPLERRGFLFAPVRIAGSLLATRWTYVPRYVVQPDFLIGALFVRTNYCHYYFGDFFEDSYVGLGFVPWFDFRFGRSAYDPNFVYYRHRFGDRGWEKNLRDYYAGRFQGDIARPPRTLAQQTTVINNITKNKTENVAINKNINITNVQNVNVLTPVAKINNTKVTSLAGLSSGQAGKNVETHVLKVETATKEQQAAAQKTVTHFREAAQTRNNAEAKILSSGGPPVKATDPPKAIKVDRPKTPTAPPSGTAPVAPPKPPPPPKLPEHVEKAIPQHEPPKSSAPPKNAAPPPPPKEPPKPPSPAPKESPKPPPPAPKEPPPKESPKPPPPAPKEPPPKKEPPSVKAPAHISAAPAAGKHSGAPAKEKANGKK